jgi:hypothetical protein
MAQMTHSSELAQLDGFLTELAKETEAQSDLLREHLETAREYLLGAMPAEYRSNLKLAGETLNGVSDKNLQARLQRFIQREAKPEKRAASKTA